jgi:hypothetical protein
MTTPRVQTAAAVVREVQGLSGPMDSCMDRWQEYRDEIGLGGGEYTDEELLQLGISADDLDQAAALLNNFNALMSNQVPLQNMWRVVVNQMRRVNAQI